jgi:hypothetical protein
MPKFQTVFSRSQYYGPLRLTNIGPYNISPWFNQAVQLAESFAQIDGPNDGAGPNGAGCFAGDPLVVTSQPPASVAAGVPFGLVVTAENEDGSTDTGFTGNVTVSDPCQTLGGATTVQAINGVAAFSGLTLDQADPNGEYLDVSASGEDGDITNMLTVTPAAATQLVVASPSPTAVATGSPFTIVVNAEDPFGNIDPTFSGNVTVALASNPGGTTLGGTLTEPAFDGVAGFYNLTLGAKAAGYTLTASSNGLTSATSPSINATDLLAVTTQPPASVTAGAPFTVAVTAENPNGSTDTSFDGSVTIADGSQNLGGTTTVTAANGVATFTGLTLDTADTVGENLGLSAAGLPDAYTNYLTVTPAAATQLVIPAVTAPVLAGQQFTQQVFAEDPYGNIDTNFNQGVWPEVLQNGTLVKGWGWINAVAGVATFDPVLIPAAGNGYAFSASSGTLNGTGPVFNVTNDQLVVLSQPTSVTAGAPFNVVVEAMNAQGIVDRSFSGAVTLSDASQTLGGTTTVTASNGVAILAPLTLDQADAAGEVISAAATGLAGVSTTPITVTAAPATHLVVPTLDSTILSGTVQGSQLPTVLTGEPFGLQVLAEDQYGNVDPTFTGNVALSLATNPGGASLSGTASVAAVEGVATFTGLSLSAPGSGYALQAANASLTAGTGSAFNVTKDQLVISTQPPANVAAGTGFGLVVEAVTGAGGVDASFNDSVTLSDLLAGQALGGTTTVTASGGVATFSGLTLSQAGAANWLLASSGSVPSAASDNFNVVPAGPSQLAVLAAPPACVSTGAAFQMQVAVEDAQGNVDTAFSGNVTLALAANPGGATLGVHSPWRRSAAWPASPA